MPKQPTENQKKVFSLVCKKCSDKFTGSLPSIRYCDTCRTRVCKQCHRVWKLHGTITKHAYDFCSIQCANKTNLKKLWGTSEFRTKMHKVGVQAGKRLTDHNVIENTHPRWKGKEVGYSALHKWVRKHLGSASKCSHCGGQNLVYHWANVSGEYKRNLTDWISLCVKCHSKFDANKKLKCPLNYKKT